MIHYRTFKIFGWCVCIAVGHEDSLDDAEHEAGPGDTYEPGA